MARQAVPTEKINALCTLLFVAVLLALQGMEICSLWEGVVAAFGAAIASRQFLLGRVVDLLFAVIVFGGVWTASFYNLFSRVTIPLLFVLGAVYVVALQVSQYRERQLIQAEAEIRARFDVSDDEPV